MTVLGGNKKRKEFTKSKKYKKDYDVASQLNDVKKDYCKLDEGYYNQFLNSQTFPQIFKKIASSIKNVIKID